MQINTKYSIGDKVYLHTDIEQDTHIITEIKLQGCSKHPLVVYELTLGHQSSEHYEIEITLEENKVLKYQKQ